MLANQGPDAVGMVVAGVIGDEVDVRDPGFRHFDNKLVGRTHIGKAGEHDGLPVSDVGKGLFHAGRFGTVHCGHSFAKMEYKR